MVDEQWNEANEESGEPAGEAVTAAETVDVAIDDSQVPPQYGVGPFSIREVALVGVWIAAFVVSYFPVTATISGAFVDVQVTWTSVWLAGLTWVLTIAVPTVAVFLVVLRRLSPQGIRRVGSLGIDQFASVAFSVSAVVWLTYVWETVAIAAQSGLWVRSWVIWVELLLMLAGVVLTVFAPFIPPFADDFDYRGEIPAHRNARPVRAVSPRPAPAPRPEPVADFSDYAPTADAAPPVADAPGSDAPDSDVPGSDVPGADVPGADVPRAQEVEPTDWAPSKSRDTYEAVDVPAESSGRHQAFWALAPEERDVVDEVGVPVFRIGPSAWALVIEDRGESFVVRSEDGRVGFLHDVSDVTRG